MDHRTQSCLKGTESKPSLLRTHHTAIVLIAIGLDL